jgi:leader peptidase (prepilin peptidase) / N-methyltransferase
MAYPALLTFVGVLGLVAGSFLNVVIHRVPRAESVVRPGSRCPTCGVAVRAWQNVPVLGWLLLRGRCAGCRVRISVRYPLVELGTAALFVALAAHFGLHPALPAFLYLGAVAVALAMIDIDVRRLPNVIVLPSYAVGALLLALPGDWGAVARGLAAMALLYLGFAAVRHGAGAYLRGRGHEGGAMGGGDVKLAGLVGLYLGWLGWSWVVVGTFAGFLVGAVLGVGLLAVRGARLRTAIPYGPFMLAGALLAVFATPAIRDWYLGLLTVPLS